MGSICVLELDILTATCKVDSGVSRHATFSVFIESSLTAHGMRRELTDLIACEVGALTTEL